MSEIVERVAAAIAGAFPDGMTNYSLRLDKNVPCTWDEWDGLSKEVYRRRAIAALTALDDLKIVPAAVATVLALEAGGFSVTSATDREIKVRQPDGRDMSILRWHGEGATIEGVVACAKAWFEHHRFPFAQPTASSVGAMG